MSSCQTHQFRILIHFAHCEDPRKCRIQHQLIDIIVIVVLATLCGNEGWEDFHDWAEDRGDFLREFLTLQNGIPSADTLRRVIERLNPDSFLEAFLSWGKEISNRLPGQINIDGKSLRKALNESGMLHLVSAFCTANRMVLGSIDSGGKGKEIPAIKQLLNTLALQEGDIVTTDAIGCQKDITSQIRKQKADYVIALKKNQENLWNEAENFFSQAIAAEDYASCSKAEYSEKSRGREERHEVWVTEELEWLDKRHEWNGLNSLILIRRTRRQEDQETTESRYYISSLNAPPEKLGLLIRNHWSIENQYHWHLDVTFKEDSSVISAKANKNLRVARNIALQILKVKDTEGLSIRKKMKKCDRSEDYLRKVLSVGNF
jgi:predicted transposase YbfD/YdcC